MGCFCAHDSCMRLAFARIGTMRRPEDSLERVCDILVEVSCRQHLSTSADVPLGEGRGRLAKTPSIAVSPFCLSSLMAYYATCLTKGWPADVGTCLMLLNHFGGGHCSSLVEHARMCELLSCGSKGVVRLSKRVPSESVLWNVSEWLPDAEEARRFPIRVIDDGWGVAVDATRLCAATPKRAS